MIATIYIREWHPLLPSKLELWDALSNITQCSFCHRLTDSRLTPDGRNSTFRVCRPCANDYPRDGLEMDRYAGEFDIDRWALRQATREPRRK